MMEKLRLSLMTMRSNSNCLDLQNSRRYLAITLWLVLISYYLSGEPKMSVLLLQWLVQ
jgi:hypothetical protein